MKVFTNIILGIAAAVLLLGVIAEKEKEKRRDVTLCFIATMATIVAANTIM